MEFDRYPRQRPGGPRRPEPFNRYFRGIEDLMRRHLGGGLAGSGGADYLDDDREVRLRLSGAANPYTGSLVQGTPGGGWQAVGGGTFTTQVYVMQDPGGLGGKVVRARLDEGGVWRAPYPRRGGHLTFGGTILSCNGGTSGGFPTYAVPIPGVALTLDHAGTTVGTATTTGTGSYSFSGLSAGTYTLQSAAVAHYQALNQTVTVPAGVGAGNFLLPPDSTHVGGIAGYYTGVPKVLTITTPVGTTTLTYDAARSPTAAGVHYWSGCQVGSTHWTATGSGGSCVVNYGGSGSTIAVYFVLAARCGTATNPPPMGSAVAVWSLSASPTAYCIQVTGGGTAFIWGVNGSADIACNGALTSATMPLASPSDYFYVTSSTPAPGSPFALTMAQPTADMSFARMLWDLAPAVTTNPTILISG